MVRQVGPGTLVPRVPDLAQAGAVHAVAATAAAVRTARAASRRRHHCFSVVRQQRTHFMVSDGHRRFGELESKELTNKYID